MKNGLRKMLKVAFILSCVLTFLAACFFFAFLLPNLSSGDKIWVNGFKDVPIQSASLFLYPTSNKEPILDIRISENPFGLSKDFPFDSLKIKQKYFNKIVLEVDPEADGTTISSEDFILFNRFYPSLKHVTIKVRTEELKEKWIELLSVEKSLEPPEYKDIVPEIIQ